MSIIATGTGILPISISCILFCFSHTCSYKQRVKLHNICFAVDKLNLFNLLYDLNQFFPHPKITLNHTLQQETTWRTLAVGIEIEWIL